jgi:hypothetical protein
VRCRVLLVRLRGLRSRETGLQLRLWWLRPVRCGVLLVRLRGLRLKRLRFQSPHPPLPTTLTKQRRWRAREGGKRLGGPTRFSPASPFLTYVSDAKFEASARWVGRSGAVVIAARCAAAV